MKEYTKEDIGNAVYGEMSIDEREEFIRYTIKAIHKTVKKTNGFDNLELIKAPCICIIHIIMSIEKEQTNAKKKG